MRAFVVVISGLLLAAPAFAQASSDGDMSGSGAALASEQTESPDDASTPGTEANGERRICRRVETGPGSRMSYRRLCLTAEQWRNVNRRR